MKRKWPKSAKKSQPFCSTTKPKEAARFYTSLFESSRIVAIDRYNESISLFIECETQGEIDEFWSKLSEGGKERLCGWLTDRFGLSWQIAPTRLLELLSGDDRETAAAAMRALFEMKRIVIADIERAAKLDRH